jgi:branched-chain amino acid transport system substrate-binding protein
MGKISVQVKIYSAILLISLVLPGCAPARPAVSLPAARDKGGSGPILIGAALCLTGVMAFADDQSLRGAQLAVDDLNQRGGVLGRKVQLASLDCKSDVATAASVTDQLIQQGAQAIIAPGTYYFGAASSREAQKAGIVSISPTASSTLYNSVALGDKQFTLSMWNNTMAAAAAEYAYKTRGWATVALITEGVQDYTVSLSRYFSDAYKKLGGVVLSEDSFATGAPDYSAQLAHLQELPKLPDFLFVATGQPNLSKLIQTLRDAGIQLPILGGDSYDDPDLVQALGLKYGDEVYYVTHTFLAAGVTPDMAHFLSAYQAKYQQAPTGLSAPGWDAVMVLAQAMQKAGSTDGPAMAKVMENNEFSLLTGRLRWSTAAQGHQPNIEGALVKLAHGQPAFVGWIQPADTPAP